MTTEERVFRKKELDKQLAELTKVDKENMLTRGKINKELEQIERDELCEKFGCEPTCENCRFNCLELVGSEYNTCVRGHVYSCNGEDMLPNNVLSDKIGKRKLSDYEWEKIAELCNYDSIESLLLANDKYANDIYNIYISYHEFLTKKRRPI